MPISRSASASSPAPWHIADSGLHPDQSFLGKPIDREVVSRVRRTLDKYKGPRNLAEHEALISKRAEEHARKSAETAAEYWAWTQKVKEEVEPSFKLPEDAMKGRVSNDAYIKSKVKKGLREIQAKTSDYKAWAEDLKVRHARKMREKLQEKLNADAEFANAAAARDHDRALKDAAIVAEVQETQAKYWKWLREMKGEIAKRPGSAPPPVDTAESAAAQAKKKQLENLENMKKMTAEYNEWVKSCGNPTFELPFHPVVDRAEQERRDASARRRILESKKAGSAYFEEIRRLERKHHERIMKKVDDKAEADRQFNELQQQAAAGLAAKQAAEKDRQRQVELQSRRELREMKKRVRDKEMIIENIYKG